jgi:hypothetical protein
VVVLRQITLDMGRAYVQGKTLVSAEQIVAEWPHYATGATRPVFVGAVQAIQRSVQAFLEADRQLSQTEDEQLNLLREQRRKLNYELPPHSNPALLAGIAYEGQRFVALANRELSAFTTTAQEREFQECAQWEARAQGLARRLPQLEQDREALLESACGQERWARVLLGGEAALLAVGNIAAATHALSPLEQLGAVFGGLGGAWWLTTFASYGMVPLLEFNRHPPPPRSGTATSKALVRPAVSGLGRQLVSLCPGRRGQWLAAAVFVLSAPALALVRDGLFGGQVDGLNVPMLLAQTIMSLGASLASALADHRAASIRQEAAEVDTTIKALCQEAHTAEVAVVASQKTKAAREEAFAAHRGRCTDQFEQLETCFEAYRADQATHLLKEEERQRNAQIQNELDQSAIIECKKRRESQALEGLIAALGSTLRLLAAELDRAKETELQHQKPQERPEGVNSSAGTAGRAAPESPCLSLVVWPEVRAGNSNGRRFHRASKGGLS